MKAGQWREAVHGYLASIAFADAQVYRILKALEKRPVSAGRNRVVWGRTAMIGSPTCNGF